MSKRVILLIAVLALCTASNMKCLNSEKKNKMCTREYNPICGISFDKTTGELAKTTYGNRCSACSDASVAFLAEGACENYPKEAVFCHPDAGKQKFCTMEYMPVCGLFDSSVQCIKAPCGNTFGNKCGACTSGNVAYYIPGECDEIKA